MPAVNRYYSSVAVDTTLSFSISSTDLTIVVGSTAGFPTSYPYTLALGYDLSNEELVTIIGASGTTLTIGLTPSGGANIAGRGVDGTNDQAHAAGEPVKHVISARDMTESQAHIAAESGAHGVTGAIVGTTDTQTLTNKTITGGTVNATTLQQGGVPAVTTTGTQTLTNKTLTSPAFSDPTITGTITGAVITSANIVDGTIVNADINASAAIDKTKISGTAVTVADTGTVTSTMIADGTIVNGDINASAAIADTKLATIATAGKVSNSATTATDANTGSAIVARDSSGNFSAGTITASLTGNVSGNATTSSSTTGNAATATALQTARTINGASFNGTANIKTHAGGQGASDASGLTQVNHGLGVTPSGITVTPRTNTYSGSPRIYFVTDVGATSFYVYALDTAGTQRAASFYWTAVV